jgi:hypothetical protein
MNDVEISHIALDSAGRLRVHPRPASVEYAHIYRAASSVRWDTADRCLCVLPVDGFTVIDELRQIIAAVASEYGDSLYIDDSTVLAVEPQVADQLRNAGRRR